MAETIRTDRDQRERKRRRWSLGVVSYLNARPLIEGLECDGEVDLVLDVPAKLPAMLDRGLVDAALVPVVDLFQREHRWQVVSDACIACDGETLTVRVFSRVQPAAIRTLHVDGDSHTSVILARILWRELYSCDPEIVPFGERRASDECQAVLLIGDKVIKHRGIPGLIDHNIETDLGQAWKSLTSLPFVFAIWAMPREDKASGLAQRLSLARDTGVASAKMIAADFGPGLGWPIVLAQRYLTCRLKYTLGPRERLGMDRFRELARIHNLITGDPVAVSA